MHCWKKKEEDAPKIVLRTKKKLGSKKSLYILLPSKTGYKKRKKCGKNLNQLCMEKEMKNFIQLPYFQDKTCTYSIIK